MNEEVCGLKTTVLSSTSPTHVLYYSVYKVLTLAAIIRSFCSSHLLWMLIWTDTARWHVRHVTCGQLLHRVAMITVIISINYNLYY